MLLSYFLGITKRILIILLLNDLKGIPAMLFWHNGKAYLKIKLCVCLWERKREFMLKDRKSSTDTQ